MVKDRNLTIETVRGLAVFFVVLGHVIGIDGQGGMKVADDSIYRYLDSLLRNMMIPPFAMIAGLVYAMRPIRIGMLRSFVGKKMMRLLLPMAVVGTVYFLVQYFIPGTNVKQSLTDIWKIYVFPYTYFWYLPALFLVLLTIGIVDFFHLLDRIKGWYILMLLSSIATYCEFLGVIPSTIFNLFAFRHGLFLLPFFIFGLGLVRFNDVLASRKMIKIYFVLALAGTLLQQLYFFYPQNFVFYEDWYLKMLTGIFISALFLNLKWNNRFFVYLAGYAYTIYLFHGFGTAGGRIILKRMGITSDFLIFSVTLLIALIAPIFMDKVLSHWNLTRGLFLGKGNRKA